MLSTNSSPSRAFATVAPLYRQASQICQGYLNQNKIVSALDFLGPEEKNYAMIYLDGHIECAKDITEKNREIQWQYNQLKRNMWLDYPQHHILLEVGAKLINEGYQIKVVFDCNHSCNTPKFVEYIVSKHHNRSSSYISMHYEPFDDYCHIYPDDVKHLIN